MSDQLTPDAVLDYLIHGAGDPMPSYPDPRPGESKLGAVARQRDDLARQLRACRVALRRLTGMIATGISHPNCVHCGVAVQPNEVLDQPPWADHDPGCHIAYARSQLPEAE